MERKTSMDEFVVGMYLAKLSKGADKTKVIKDWIVLKLVENIEDQWTMEGMIDDTSK